MNEIKHKWIMMNGHYRRCENCGMSTWFESPTPEMKFFVYKTGKPPVEMSCGEIIADGVLDE